MLARDLQLTPGPQEYLAAGASQGPPALLSQLIFQIQDFLLLAAICHHLPENLPLLLQLPSLHLRADAATPSILVDMPLLPQMSSQHIIVASTTVVLLPPARCHQHPP